MDFKSHFNLKGWWHGELVGIIVYLVGKVTHDHMEIDVSVGHQRRLIISSRSTADDAANFQYGQYL